MKDAKGFIILKTHVPGIELLTREQKGLLLEALIADMLGKDMPDMDPVTNVVFTMMIPSIHEAQQEYERKAQVSRENGMKGGRPKKPQPEQETNRLTEKPAGFEETRGISENQNRIDKNRIELNNINPPITTSVVIPPSGGTAPSKKSKTVSKAVHPSPDEVQQYCDARNNGISGQAFCDYYAAQGWKLSNGQPLKDWQAAVRQWERRDQERKADAVPKPTSYAQQIKFEQDQQARALLARSQQRREENAARRIANGGVNSTSQSSLPPWWGTE